MRFIDGLLRTLGIAQGAYFLWFTVGGGAVVTGVGVGLLAAYSDLPWWSVAVICVGLFMIGAGVANFLVASVARRVAPRSEAYHALTNVIESGRRLRERLSQLETEPSVEEQKRWTLRVETWTEDANDTVRRFAPFRMGSFLVDTLIVDYPGRATGRPEMIARWEYEVESVLERLLLVRITL